MKQIVIAIALLGALSASALAMRWDGFRRSDNVEDRREIGMVIQVGAFPAENEARERLQSAQSVAQGLLGKADPFTERVMRGTDALYRARFTGLDESRAEAACRHLKRNKIDCITVSADR